VRGERPFDLVIFDLDGTLVSSLEGITACLTRALAEFGYSAPAPDDVRQTVGLTLEQSIGRFTRLTPADSAVGEIVRTYRELHTTEAAPRIRLFDGAAATLRSIAAAGITTVLVSNKGSGGLRQSLEQLEIGAHFDLVLGADNVIATKPDGALYEAHIRPVFPRIPAGRLLVVGDTETDLRFAANIHARSCWATYGYGDPGACTACNPDFSLGELSQLAAVCGV
jgi:phosphoglycolate phosphatase